MRTIPLWKAGKVVGYATVDDEDCDLDSVRWRIDRHGYAKHVTTKKGQVVTKMMHRVVLSRMAGRTLNPTELADHINRNKLDNRRGNLRVANKSLNSANREVDRVTWHAKAKKWQASLCRDGKAHYVGLFTTKDEAIEAAKKAFRSLWPELV